MSTIWDDFIAEHEERLPVTQRDLLKMFYHYLVEKGYIE
jgi:hypothetical protein